jgi:hypothetical protein
LAWKGYELFHGQIEDFDNFQGHGRDSLLFFRPLLAVLQRIPDSYLVSGAFSPTSKKSGGEVGMTSNILCHLWANSIGIDRIIKFGSIDF